MILQNYSIVTKRKHLKIRMTNFKELNAEGNIDKKIVKAGLSLAIIFSKEDIRRFKLDYGDVLRLDFAEILKSKNI